jgi:predicted O-methyltransferase YrrM
MELPRHHTRIVARRVEDIHVALGLRESSHPPPAFLGKVSTDWSLEPELLHTLCALVRQTRPAVIVELGTFKGRTAAALGSVVRELGVGHVYTIDDFRSVNSSHSRRLFEELALGDAVTQIPKSTVDAFSDWGREAIDILLVDAAHDYASSCIDLALWSRLVSRCGWIVVHDTRTRLLRRFPEDYVFPGDYYDVLEVEFLHDGVVARPWEGVAFIRYRNRSQNGAGFPGAASRFSHEPELWAGRIEV